MDQRKGMTIEHPIPPLYDSESRILILGSFPSVKSRESAFFYGHPQNRFWKVLAELFSWEVPETVEQKKELLHRNHVAVWDVIKQCDIIGSSDSSIKKVIPNDLSEILEKAPVKAVFCNGATSWQYYHKYQEKKTGIEAVKLPSTSPANAAFSIERLVNAWKVILEPLQIAPKGIGKVLLDWYDYNARILPWRSDPTPYHVWISEIMLQQTRVEAVKKYYDRWMEVLPDIPSLAKAQEETLLKLWEGLGYYNRVRNIHTAAISVMEEYGGELPADYDKLCSLKGIGEYTAGAIASIAFGLAEPAIDGNVLRVFSRILACEEEIQSGKAKKIIRREVLRILPENRPGDFNQALMDLGAQICLPNGKPLCEKCPWESICLAHKQERETDFPIKAAKKGRKKQDLGVFIIETEDQVVLHKRGNTGLLANLWEFPNVEGIFTLEKASKQLSMWGIKAEEMITVGKKKHIFSHIEWHMTTYKVRAAVIPQMICQKENWTLAVKTDLEEKFAMPSAFEEYKTIINGKG